MNEAINSNDIKRGESLFEIGECLYPFWTDMYGHPCFFKEWVRFLLSKDKYDEAIKLMENKMNFYRGIITESDLKILFERYKNNGVQR